MITPGILAVFLIILALSGFQSYRLGGKEGEQRGINETLDHLIEEGRLEVAEETN